MKRVYSYQFTVHRRRETVNRELSTVNHHGQILVIAIIFLAVVLVLSATLFERVAGFLRFGANTILREQATVLAEAGVERALWQLNQTAGAYSGETNTRLGSTGSFTVTITNKTASLKTITATGYVPDTTNAQAKRTIKVDAYIGAEQIAFNYATQTDIGGLEMNSNATINGNAYTNGNIVGTSNSRINGDAFASGTISSPDPTITGTTNPSASPKPLPEFDAQYWKDQANINNDPYIGNLTFNAGSYDLGPKKIQGNLTLNSNAWLTIHGPIHVTGNFTMNSNTRLYIDESFGSSGTVVVVDGTIQLNSNAEVFATSATPKGYILLASSKSPPGNSIELNSNAKAGVLYTLSGNLQINSNAQVVALAANKLLLNSNATLNYDQGLASAQFSGGPGGSWQIKKGTYRFTSSP